MRRVIKNPYCLAVLSGVLLRLSFPKPSVWILAWLAFVPLFLAVEGRRPRHVFLLAFLSGLIFYLSTLSWLTNVTTAGLVLLSAYLALYTGFFFLAYDLLKRGVSLTGRLLLAGGLWVSLEYLRGCLLTGFPWALLGYSQSFNLVALQVADLAGVYGVSFMVMLVNILLYEYGRHLKAGRAVTLRHVLLPFVLVLFWLGYGIWRLQEVSPRDCPIRVSIIQGNIPQEVKWVYQFKDRIVNQYRLLTELARLRDDPALTIWPETAYPAYFGQAPEEEFQQTVRSLQPPGPLLMGAIRQDEDRYYNSAILFSAEGEVRDTYDKFHLVPFGEYVPLRWLLPFLDIILPIHDFAAGRGPVLFTVSGGRCPPLSFATLICFEDIFGDLARRSVQRGADFLVNMTNDAWFGDTASPYQHMQASVLRAVENRVFVLRAANTGISCFIDDAGRVFATVQDSSGKESFVTGFKTAVVARARGGSLYTRLGDAFVFLCALYSFLMCGIFFRRSLHERRAR